MTTPAQIAANRRNALKSTGPRTAAGKAASSRNGLRHGLTSRRAVVRGEDAQDFERFRAELRSALAPRDAREEVLAETVVYAAWRMRRAWRAEAQLFNRAAHLDPVFSQPRELLTVIRHEASANRAFHRALALLERGRSAAGTVRASPREGGRLDKIVYEKGTQFPDARLSPNALAPLASRRFDRSRQLSWKTVKKPGRQPKTISERPESPLILRGPPLLDPRGNASERGGRCLRDRRAHGSPGCHRLPGSA
jgi:hypothetical protein